MLRLALLFFVIALVAALLGSNLVAFLAFDVARILVIAFLILAVISLVFGYRRRWYPDDL